MGQNHPRVAHVHVLVTRNDDGGSGVDHAAVRPDAVPPGCRRLHFETYFFVRWVLQFKVGGDYICERTCGTNTHTHTHSSRLAHEQNPLLCQDRRLPTEGPRENSPNHPHYKQLSMCHAAAQSSTQRQQWDGAVVLSDATQQNRGAFNQPDACARAGAWREPLGLLPGTEVHLPGWNRWLLLPIK